MLLLYAALLAHWFADFPLQAWGHRHMRHKATSLRHLANHIAAYTVGILFVMSMVATEASIVNGRLFAWVAANGVLHGCIDYWTSKATAHFHGKQKRVEEDLRKASPEKWPFFMEGVGNRHMGPFWCVIGFDQFLHVAFLVWSGFELGVLA